MLFNVFARFTFNTMNVRRDYLGTRTMADQHLRKLAVIVIIDAPVLYCWPTTFVLQKLGVRKLQSGIISFIIR